ncbi:MAG: Tfp pilus biogenesis protein PilC, type IV pilus assembly protein PilC [Candidatus Gottesmanbacteria bacterium GW2011_GWA2_43_14]|uniref:Tfp pilus biogenesis protein PilC, type IV pilus assembly protein PilC n=1 Tax=Candidatus Gottesmanbacteria bacterium GW2011_GWA2_43_14 TaxID=1618443 RepID=A0A0G1DK18_9BACT|nr:MAG: Tfp pilus biogenesis protein PilC, type IV pilus assembly protein PilC [Candidatus Gottesmanbacteria bacterium GW2011_GWA2_43_14]
MKTSGISLNSGEKISLIQNLSTMLSAGISLLEAIDALLEDARGKHKKFLEIVKEDVSQGNHLYNSFSRFPLVFDAVTVNLLKASEEAGTLETTLQDLKSNIQKEMEFSDKVKSAMIYPVLIGMVFLGVLLLMLVVVVPKISSVFLRLRMELPMPTKILIALSDLLVKNTLMVFVVMGVSAAVVAYLFRNHRHLILAPLIHLPVISGLVREMDLTRFSRSFSLLLHAGVPIISALDLTKDVVISRDTYKIIVASGEMVAAGKKLSEGFKLGKGIIPSIMIKLMEVGEKSGALEKSMQEISDYMDYQVSKSLRTFTALLEPVMLLVVGVLVGGMMMAIIAPIYGLIGQVGIR